MALQDCLHIIKIENLQSDDNITHQLLLIKGKVEHPKCLQAANITLKCESLEILTTGLSEGTGKFKFLLNLGNEFDKEFLLKFQYCSAQKDLTVNYKPKVSAYKIQPLVFVAQDESVDERVRLYQQIVDLNILLIQSVYAEKLNEKFGKRLCFVLRGKCEIFTSRLSKQDIWQLNEDELWSYFARELLESQWGVHSQLKFVSFIACSKYFGEDVVQSGDFSYENIRKHTRGHAACGAGGLALFSSTYFYSWPSDFRDILKCFINNDCLNLLKEPDESNYRKTRGGVYASSLGAVCHEIGHIFDLGHDMEGVMGSNFDYINHVFTLNEKTEHLPKRVVSGHEYGNIKKPRVTQLIKTTANNFLDCYREQKENDSFYFSPNAIIILSHHPWLKQDCNVIDNNDFKVELDTDKCVLESKTFALKLIEIRKKSNSLVTEWFEFQKHTKDMPVFRYDLTRQRQKLVKESYIFAMSCNGHFRKIAT